MSNRCFEVRRQKKLQEDIEKEVKLCRVFLIPYDFMQFGTWGKGHCFVAPPHPVTMPYLEKNLTRELQLKHSSYDPDSITIVYRGIFQLEHEVKQPITKPVGELHQ